VGFLDALLGRKSRTPTPSPNDRRVRYLMQKFGFTYNEAVAFMEREGISSIGSENPWTDGMIFGLIIAGILVTGLLLGVLLRRSEES